MFKVVKFFAVFIAAVLIFTGCNNAVTTDEIPLDTSEVTQTCYVTSETTFDTEISEATEQSNSTYITVTTEPSLAEIYPTGMCFPDSFYDEFNSIIDKYPQLDFYNLSLVYCDIKSGFTFELNPQLHYYIASVIKAPYALYLYRQALEGKVDLNRKITYTEDFFVEGTGLIKDMEFDTELTVEELIGYMLEWSDNCAYAMLRSVYPEKDYIEYIKTLGVNHAEDLQIKNIEQICDDSALCYGIAIYNFIEENNEYSDTLKQHMLHTRERLIRSENGDVVRKYGWFKGYLHDLAIVYDERPYVLAILSDFGEGEDEGADDNDKQIFKDMSLLFDKYSYLLESTSDEKVFITETTTITTTERNTDTMEIPHDPAMLLSYINTQLRDKYENLDALCEDLDLNEAYIEEKLASIDYVYDENLNKFC